jgi:purine/pyrimidine-nucleoside phosphorylase
MFQVNEYFDGKVKSLGYETSEGRATIGIMAPGEYEFGTSSKEIMKVTSGQMKVKLPGQSNWQVFKANDIFEIEPGKKFQLIIEEPCSYLCLYR